ncbi:MAG: type I DNA topoisomerase, partial [Candidatus Krumholzibacteria bacterium]|nr:type I DNA topoisomerase [Candidatus Krumholzibacteria bacterium]
MARTLVIVESPAKARTIKKYLGKGFSVKASVGHVRDLPKRELGIDIERGFKPTYVTVRGKTKVLKELRTEAAASERILLATDMDREGEAIAWHLEELLKGKGVPIKRIIFNEITKQAIREAVDHPHDIDLKKVDAQQARRILDRLVGYLVSPVLWKIFYRGLSAGRVQTVGLRLICEREGEIRRFVPREYWTIEAVLAAEGDRQFEARLHKIDGRSPEMGTEEEARGHVDAIRGSALRIAAVTDREKNRHPQPPFITSTLQREAASRLGFSAKKTMTVAQQLYEGIELGPEGSIGLISYMRTDSTRVSREAAEQGAAWLREHLGEEAVGGKRGFAQAKLAQDAHEAIRPTDVMRTPEDVGAHLTADQRSLYSLIWRRFLASLASPAVYEVLEVDIEAGGRYLLRASGRRLLRPGFLAVFPDRKTEDESWLPELREGEAAEVREIGSTQHFTEPPPRFSEASLIKELEDKGIGRPSTYASILSIIIDRGYVEKDGRALRPTELGEKVWESLSKLFNDIFEVDFTARMEGQLDRIEAEGEQWQDVVSFFYKPLTVDLGRFTERKAELVSVVQEQTEETCPNCGRNLVRKWSRNGPFLACPGFPKCRYSRSLEEEETIDRTCPECGGALIYKNGRFGRFIACSGYPECRYTEAVSLGIPCPENGCDGE